MYLEDEKDYIMRMIRQLVRALTSVILGKEFKLVELPKENKYNVSGTPLQDYLDMVDQGRINEAENRILEDPDYSDKNEIAGLICFYEYISRKEEDFLEEHDYSAEEVLDGLKQVADRSGFGNMIDLFINDLPNFDR